MVLSSAQVKLCVRLSFTQTNADFLWTGPLETNFNYILMVMQLFHEIPFKNRYLIIENIVCIIWATFHRP